MLEEAFLDAGLIVVLPMLKGVGELNDVLGGHAQRQTLPDFDRHSDADDGRAIV